MDERLANIQKEKQNAINQSNAFYNNLQNDNQSLYDQQNEFADKQNEILDNNLDKQLAFQQETINRQKEIARQNKATEDKKAKNDYTNFVNPYGNSAESLATNGLNNSGVSETSKLGGFNTYQNRLANSNKVLQDAISEYDLTMNEARMNNDVQKAQNALKRLELKLSYSQDFYNNKATIGQNQINYNQNLDNNYYNRYQTEYNNIQNEKQREEAIRQFNQQMAYQRERDKIADDQWKKEYELSKKSMSNRSTSTKSSKTNTTSLTNGSSPSNTTSSNVSKGISAVLGGIANLLPKFSKKSTNSSKNTKKASTTQKYYADSSPNLSSQRASKWFSTQIGSKYRDGITNEQLASVIYDGLRSGNIKKDDVDRIYSVYGLK